MKTILTIPLGQAGSISANSLIASPIQHVQIPHSQSVQPTHNQATQPLLTGTFSFKFLFLIYRIFYQLEFHATYDKKYI